MTKKCGRWRKTWLSSRTGDSFRAVLFESSTYLTYSLDRLSQRLKSLQEDRNGDIDPIITFDKDDVDTLDFVAASANLRSTIFGIEAKSKFDIKRMLNEPLTHSA